MWRWTVGSALLRLHSQGQREEIPGQPKYDANANRRETVAGNSASLAVGRRLRQTRLRNQHHMEVHNIRVGGTGDQEIAGHLQKVIRIISSKIITCVEAIRRRSSQRTAVHDASRSIRGTIRAIGAPT
jgi:hypothetical protein